MYAHFGLPIHSNTNGLDAWVQSKSRRILVLRNPYDRVMSAIRAAHKPYTVPSNETKEQWIADHTYNYLHTFSRQLDFEIIDFYRLSEYIDVSDHTISSDSNNIHRMDVPDDPALRQEYIQYKYFMKHCKQISPEEWRELTCS
jgi:hypothetical protein